MVPGSWHHPSSPALPRPRGLPGLTWRGLAGWGTDSGHCSLGSPLCLWARRAQPSQFAAWEVTQAQPSALEGKSCSQGEEQKTAEEGWQRQGQGHQGRLGERRVDSPVGLTRASAQAQQRWFRLRGFPSLLAAATRSCLSSFPPPGGTRRLRCCPTRCCPRSPVTWLECGASGEG